jgi:hypothetical protein
MAPAPHQTSQNKEVFGGGGQDRTADLGVMNPTL